ncbi:MAG: hypothetical protein KF729_21215 [Sandaracinaceae bacterium]|nr:hypothetical protein [Sandaracinaceae bacterium]
MDAPPRWLGWTVGLAALAGIGWLAADARTVADDLGRARDLHGADHATSSACQRCHPAQFASWARTFHRTMTQDASARSVLGDFDGARLEYGGVTAHLERTAEGRFAMRFVDPSRREWSRATVVRTIGSRRYQQYLAADGDVLFRLPVAWHIEEQRWFHMNGAFLTPDPIHDGPHVAPADYYRHVTRWNDNCIFCHNVSPRPGHDGEAWRSEVAELGIACEACHGPAAEHAAANADPVRRYALHLSGAPDPTIVNPRRLSPERSAEVCGRCHGQRLAPDVGRFLRDGDPYVPGDVLSDYTRPLARDTPLGGDPTAFAERFWPDGTARLTAYEYQGLLASRCDGLTCTSCHGMHEGDPRGQLRDAARGDGACTSCHAEEELASRSHTGHRAPIECVECHMPRVVYGVVEAHRSHRIERPIPRGDRPGACALCHADRTDAWVAAGYGRLYGRALEAPRHPYAAWPRVHRDAAGGDPIERAVSVAALGRRAALVDRAGRIALLLDVMVEDPYPAVRHLAWRSLGRLAPMPAGYVPEGPREARSEWVERARLGPARADPELADLRARAASDPIFIGE